MAARTGSKLSGSGLAWAVTYGVISVVITLFNKAVLTSYGFSAAMTLTLLQGLVSVVGCELLKATGKPELQYPAFNLKTVWQVAPLSFVFIAYVVISLMALERVNIPMFTALRRLTICFVMVEEYFLLDKTSSVDITRSVYVMMLGAAIAAWKDLTFDPVSYFYLFLTNLFTSLYTVYIVKVRKDTQLNPLGSLFYCNVSAMPVLLVFAIWSGDVAKASAFTHWHDLAFQVNFFFSVTLAFVMNVSVFYCNTINGALTQTVVGQLKNFAAFVLGLILFNDYIYEPFNMLGLWVGFGGSVWYSWIEFKEKRERELKASEAKAALDSNKAALAAAGAADGGSSAIAVASSGGSGGDASGAGASPRTADDGGESGVVGGGAFAGSARPR